MRAQQIFLKHTYSHERICAISDGVYAIALTLLVLDLKVPELSEVTNRQLITDLVQQLSNFFAYIVSFSVVAFFWMSHHRIFQSITCCDSRAQVLNFVHLLFISLTPYVASLIGHYEGDRVATIAFSLSLGLASLSLIVLGQYVLAKENWRTDETGGTWVKLPLWVVYAGPVVALVSIGISFVNIDVALFLWLLLPLREVLFMNREFPAPSRSGHN